MKSRPAAFADSVKTNPWRRVSASPAAEAVPAGFEVAAEFVGAMNHVPLDGRKTTKSAFWSLSRSARTGMSPGRPHEALLVVVNPLAAYAMNHWPVAGR